MNKETEIQFVEKHTPRIKSEAVRLLDHSVTETQTDPLGEIMVKTDIQSLTHTKEGEMVPTTFNVLPEYKIKYPEIVVQALGSLYTEYNRAFDPLVKANREWYTDYQYAMSGIFRPPPIPKESIFNYFVQIDMVGLPDGFLENASDHSESDVREALRGKIFEIENSLAMYQLIENIFSTGEQVTLFNKQFRGSLDELREKHGKPIALLAVTDQKYQAMKASEFGKKVDEPITDADVMELSGFDRFFGPEDFKQYLTQNKGECDYLLYARTSDPIAKLKKPDTKVEIPLLENDHTRRVIKANAITFNIDNPAWEIGDPNRINDTKAYLPPMGMAYPVSVFEDVMTDLHLTDSFKEYLQSQGVDPKLIELNSASIRAKPLQGSYGCYGHLRGPLTDKRLRQELRKYIQNRGPYVVQPEMDTPKIINETTGQAYTYIDRNFMSFTNGQPKFIGGFRSLMPIESKEAENGRIHGNGSTIWAEIS